MNHVNKIAKLVQEQQELMRALDDLKAHVKHLEPGMESGEMEPFAVKLETRWTSPVTFSPTHQADIGFAIYKTVTAIVQNNLFAINKELATMELVLEANEKEAKSE